MKPMIVAIDPGKDGACVALAPEGDRALDWWTWRRGKKRHAWRVDSAYGMWLVPTMGAVGAALCAGVAACLRTNAVEDGYVLVVEGLFVAKGRSAPLKLGEAAGAVYGPLEAGSVNELSDWRPRSREWRKVVLGIDERATGKDASEAFAVRTAPTWCGGLPEKLSPHLAEAVCIARWAWLHQRRLRPRQ